MPEDREQERRQRMAEIVNADGLMTPAPDLPRGLLTAEEQRTLEADFDGSIQDKIREEADRLLAQAEEDAQHSAAETRRLLALADPSHPYTPSQPLITIKNVNSAVAHMLMQPTAEIPPTHEQTERRIRESRERMQQLWGPQRGEEDTTIEDRRAATALMPLQPDFDLSAPDLELLLLATFGAPEAVQTQLQTPDPVLAGETPAACLERGDTEAIRKLLRMAANGQPT